MTLTKIQFRIIFTDDFGGGCVSLGNLRQQLASLKGTQIASLSLTAEMLKPQNASFLKDDGSFEISANCKKIDLNSRNSHIEEFHIDITDDAMIARAKNTTSNAATKFTNQNSLNSVKTVIDDYFKTAEGKNIANQVSSGAKNPTTGSKKYSIDFTVQESVGYGYQLIDGQIYRVNNLTKIRAIIRGDGFGGIILDSVYPIID